LHHVVLEEWSRRGSFIHRRDPRAKAVALLVFLLVLATAQRGLPVLAAGLLMLLSVTVLIAGLPLARVLLRAGIVLLFTAIFAISFWISGDPNRALELLLKSYLSALAVLVVVSTTPMPVLLRGMEAAGIPRFLLMVTQFLYRYLFVVSEEARQMRKAILSRGGGFRAAAGGLATLFARSYTRAEDIHRAMLARGFSGNFRTLHTLHFQSSDAAFLLSVSLAPVAVRAAVENLIG
jgi:cobalt/nickel transport system permease protein